MRTLNLKKPGVEFRSAGNCVERSLWFTEFKIGFEKITRLHEVCSFFIHTGTVFEACS